MIENTIQREKHNNKNVVVRNNFKYANLKKNCFNLLATTFQDNYRRDRS